MLTSSNGYIAYLQFDESLREPVGNKHWKTLLFMVLSSQLIINFKKVRSPKSIFRFHNSVNRRRDCKKCLKDHKGRTLDFDDLEHCSKVVSALVQTTELMQKIDETIKENRGFPIE
jgi:hypothetical protein